MPRNIASIVSNEIVRPLWVKAAISEDDIDKAMTKKGYMFKLVPVGDYENYDPLYAKTKDQVKEWRTNPPVKEMKFKVEFL